MKSFIATAVTLGVILTTIIGVGGFVYTEAGKVAAKVEAEKTAQYSLLSEAGLLGSDEAIIDEALTAVKEKQNY